MMPICTSCGVGIKKGDSVKCKCGKVYHAKVCAVQAEGLEQGVIDACCGISRSLRGRSNRKNLSVSSESDHFSSPSGTMNPKDGDGVSLDKRDLLREIKLVVMEALEENDKLNSIEESISSLTKVTSSLRVEVMEHHNDIAELKKDVSELDSKVKAVIGGTVKIRSDEKLTDHCLRELLDRNSRKKNILLHGVAEVGGTDDNFHVVSVNYVNDNFAIEGNVNKKLFCKVDYEFVAKVIKKALGMPGGGDIYLRSFKYLRLGHNHLSNGKFRPIKIEFCDESTASFMFQSIRKILFKQEELLGVLNVSIALDRTIQQRNQYLKAKNELQMKNQSGEKNWVLRERNGMFVTVRAPVNQKNVASRANALQGKESNCQ